MASLESKDLAYANVIEITREQTDRGLVPNVAWGTGGTSEDRSQPPVGSAMLLEIYGATVRGGFRRCSIRL